LLSTADETCAWHLWQFGTCYAFFQCVFRSTLFFVWRDFIGLRLF
jgi:hypothetical protein